MSDLQFVKPDVDGIVARAKGILTKPAAEWPKIAAETTPPGKVLMSYALPLMLIGPVAGVIGQSLFGIATPFGTIRLGMGTIITTAVLGLVMAVVSLYVISWVASKLAAKFGGRDDFPAAFRLVAYALTASWVGGIFGLFPAIASIGLLFSLYSFYLFYKGASPVLGVAADKAAFYTVVTVVAAIVVNAVAALVLGAIAAPAMMASGGMMRGTEQTEMTIPGMGQIKVDGDTQTVDMGDLGKVEVNGQNGTVTVDGQTVNVQVRETPAQ